MRSKGGLVLMVIGLVLVLSAVGLTGYNVLDERQAGSNVEKAVQQLHIRTEEIAQEDTPEFVIPAYEIDPRVMMPTVEIDGVDYIGYVNLPTIQMELPVINEWSYPNMKIAPCRFYGSAYLNNMVLAAHNYVQHFGRLDRLHIGDPVQFVDVEGNEFNYTVVEMEELQPTQTKDMVSLSDGWDLTLFTCNLSGRQRLTVRCALVEEPLG